MTNEQKSTTQDAFLSPKVPVEITNEKLERERNPLDDVEFLENEAEALGEFSEAAVDVDDVMKSLDFDRLDSSL